MQVAPLASLHPATFAEITASLAFYEIQLLAVLEKRKLAISNV